MRLLFITQKLKEQDVFGVLWIRAFIKQGFDVTVICLEGGSSQSFEFPVYSLGKESGATRLRSIYEFIRLITTLEYDRVFIHMAPIWYALGWWWWLLSRVPAYLWYTHYQMQWGVRMFGWFGRRFFCATPQSLPQYQGSSKKIVLGHGIDLDFWRQRQNISTDSRRLLVVHRLSRSKRLELSLKALTLLDSDTTMDIYGIEAEPEYAAEMKRLTVTLGLGSRVTFHGTAPMESLPDIYTHYRLILNMASETIDKTMLEAMTCGAYPVTTRGNAQAIGIPSAPDHDTPEAIAQCIRLYQEKLPLTGAEMYDIVRKRHSLSGLVARMSEFIQSGT